jgi:hypothetical protein
MRQNHTCAWRDSGNLLELADTVKGEAVDTILVSTGDFALPLDRVSERKTFCRNTQSAAPVDLAFAGEVEFGAEQIQSGQHASRGVCFDRVIERRVGKQGAERGVLGAHTSRSTTTHGKSGRSVASKRSIFSVTSGVGVCSATGVLC